MNGHAKAFQPVWTLTNPPQNLQFVLFGTVRGGCASVF